VSAVIISLPNEGHGSSMSQNDLIHLDSNFKNWQESRGAELKDVDPYVYYCAEQFLKPFDLNDEEIAYGIVDGGNDGGIDAIYFIVNRDMLVRDDTDVDPKTVTRVRLVAMQMKNSGGFSPVEIDKLFFFTDDLLDLSKPASAFTAKYNKRLLEIMHTFKQQYLRVAGRFPSVSVDYYYITRGDEVKADAKAKDAVDRLQTKVKEHLNKATSTFNFVNAQALLEQVMKRPPTGREVVWAEPPLQLAEGYVGTVKLRDFYAFLRDEDGELADRIFEANVRGFQQETPVNVQIGESLRADNPPNFWLLNNGITVIAESVSNAGHKRLSLEDPQIVNGLQTSREIFSYFTEKKPGSEDRSILVKVIETKDAVVSDAVIKATNSQNKMPAASLRATDPIHHQIEDLFKQYGFYYDRRKGYYKDKGKPASRIISVVALLQAVVSIVLQRPDDARARPSDYINQDAKYESVFGLNSIPLGVYLACIQIVRRVEEFLRTTDLEAGDKRNLKYYIAFYTVCRLTGTREPSIDEIQDIGLETIYDGMLAQSLRVVREKYERLGGDDSVAKGSDFLKQLRTRMARTFARQTN
jgi:hypothetical protein